MNIVHVGTKDSRPPKSFGTNVTFGLLSLVVHPEMSIEFGLALECTLAVGALMNPFTMGVVHMCLEIFPTLEIFVTNHAVCGICKNSNHPMFKIFMNDIFNF